jgi:hypothetical protein
MPIQSSFATVAEQVASFNNNIVEILTKINSLSTTTDPSVDVRVFDTNGVLSTYSLPSFTYLKSEIERLNNSINSLYSLDTNGALIQTSDQNKFKKIITVDLNREPNPIGALKPITQFRSSKNWIFDGLLNPLISVELDLSDKIENNVRKCMTRRYMVEFNQDANGNLTTLGQSALSQFNQLYRGRTDIDLQEFENWHRTTSGIVSPNNPKCDEQMFDIEPNNLLWDGVFNVIEIEEDTLNRKLWYHLNTLDYIVNDTLEVKQLVVGAELIINQAISNTRYKVIEVSTTESNPRVRFERVEGLQPIPVGVGTLKIYSPVIYTKKLRVSVGYNERNVLFVKAMNADNNLLAKSWSKGIGYYTGDLTLKSNDSFNGQTMEQFYTNQVYDYGEVLTDLVAKKIPNTLAGTPNIVNLNPDNFKVVQINKHLTDTPNANTVKNKHNYSIALKNEVQQIQEAIGDRNKKLRVKKFSSQAAKKKFELEIDELNKKKVSKSKLLATTVNEILDLTRNDQTKIAPKYRLRGFWEMPEAVSTRGTNPQEVIQFVVQYRYVSKDGKEPTVESFKIKSNNQNKTAAFSNWNEFKSDVRKRTFDKATGKYTWQIEDVESADTPNINQLDISITANERVEIRVKSVSEVGYPDSPVESDWSDIITLDFPDDLNDVLNDNQFILQEASKEDLKVSMQADLSAKGLDEHLSERTIINQVIYEHSAEKILSGLKDENGVSLSVYEFMLRQESRIKALEEKINRIKGELEIVILRNNQEFSIGYNSETVFNVECEDYLDSFSGTGVPSGRVYANNVYVIKDFAIRIKNKSTESNLGLLSGSLYSSNTDFYNTQVPQTFWINPQDELLFSDVSGTSRTQLNNQFLWAVNYETITSQSNIVSRLAENIGNSFVAQSSNSITDILSLDEYNIGYSETQTLNFVSNNSSLLDNSKWIDDTISVGSTTKFLTTIHPVINELEELVEDNQDKIKTLDGGDEVVVPINIYFKLNALDNTQSGNNYEYINLNNQTNTVKHTKKLKFLLEDESENRPFKFTIVFNMNRNKVTFASPSKNYQTIVK